MSCHRKSGSVFGSGLEVMLYFTQTRMNCEVGRHSAGCIVALQAYLDAPERVAGLILLAPAIAAPILLQELQAAAASPDPGITNADFRDTILT
jgi:predicted alpha/beta hydrolase family esterase